MVLEYSKLSSVIPLTRPIKDLQQLVAVFEYDDFEVGDPRFRAHDLAYALIKLKLGDITINPSNRS